MTFKTHVTDWSLIGENDFVKKIIKLKFIEIEHIELKPIIIEWQFEYETRDWGIKNISAYATKVNADMTIEYYKNNDKEEIELCSKEINLAVYMRDFEMTSCLENIEDGQICITELEIDFEAKIINVVFN